MRSVISGLVGAVLSVLLTVYIAKRVGRHAPDGQLRFGTVMWVIGAACLLMAAFPILISVLANHDRDFWAKVALFIGFGAGAVYCFGEAALVRGTYDDEGIHFTTPWTGEKRERWVDLESLEFNDWCSWYTLKFRSRQKIRLSRYLSGHQLVLDKIHGVVRSNISYMDSSRK